jgi:acetoin utilization deacetylase AcuC-like enzyme
MTTPVLLITDDASPGGIIDHSHGPSHPERPERLVAIARALAGLPGDRVQREAPAREAMRAELLRVHTPEHVDGLLASRGRRLFIDEDTGGNERTIECALLAAGAGVRTVEALVRGEARSVFAVVRPPGHHAESDRAMGFCYFNNIAVAAAHAVAALGIGRVMIVDWDVHHGNGTQEIFYSRSDVLVCNIHEAGNYPGTGHAHETGSGEGVGFTVNAPLPAGSGDADYARVFREVVEPAADRFHPELVLVSAGFDAHARDPLGNMGVSEGGFAEMTRAVKAIARKHARDRLGLFLEGGYDLEALGASVRACVDVLSERE